MRRPEAAVLHLVTADEVCGRPGFVDRVGRALAAGGERVAIHLRMPTAGGRAVYQLGTELRRRASAARAALVVNDRVDVAMAVGADGVQLGSRGMRAADARRVLPPGFGLGASVHAGEAPPDEADWLFAGNVFGTPSHPDRPGAGLELIRVLSSGRAKPVIAIGGITPERVAEVRAAGARGVAVIRGVWNAADPALAVERYLEEWESDG